MSPFGPSPAQMLILQAALSRGPGSLTAWRSWRARVDPEDLDPASYRLLPLLHRSLADQGAEGSELPRIKGVRMRTWYANHILFSRCGFILKQLHAENIPTLVHRGGPIAVLYYGDCGLRPMNNLDLNVPFERIDDAVRLLEGSGWAKAGGARFARLRARRHAACGSYADGQGGVIGLRWHLLARGCRENITAEFNANAVDVRIGGAETRTPGPTEQLVLLLLRRPLFWKSASIHWVADTVTLIGAAGDRIDWSRLVELSIRLKCAHTVGAGLAFLHTNFDAGIPSEAMSALAGSRVSAGEILERLYRSGEIAGSLKRRLQPGRGPWQSGEASRQ